MDRCGRRCARIWASAILWCGCRWASRMPMISSPTSRRRWVKTAEMGKPIPSLSLLACDLAIPMSVTAGAARGKEGRPTAGLTGPRPPGPRLLPLPLPLEGVESVILENRSRDYIESRIRAGLIEQWASDLLVETGVGGRMQREGMFHNGVYFAFSGALHYINFRELVGKGVTIYGQQE